MTTLGIFLSLVLTIFLLRKLYAKNTLKNLDLSISISKTRVLEGDQLVITEVLTNNKWLPLPWVSAKFQTSKHLQFGQAISDTDAYYRNDLFHILMHQKITRRLPFVCTRRGFYTIDKVELSAWDMLMEDKSIRKYDHHISLTVYPNPLPPRELGILNTYLYGQSPTTIPINPDPFTFAGIREYAPGDAMKAINFKASAKGMGLMVNVWDFANTRQVVIVLDAKRYSINYHEYLEERAIKIAASILEYKKGVPIKLVTNGASQCPQKSAKPIETLAYLDFTNQEIEDLDFTPDNNTEYWLITPYYSKTNQALYDKLKTARTFWVMPGAKPVYEDACPDIIYI